MKRSATSKTELLEKAREIVGRDGVNGLSIRKVARECQVAVGTVYNYYPSKAELVLAVMEDFWHGVFHESGFQIDSNDFLKSCNHLYRKLLDSFQEFRVSFLNEMDAMGHQRMAKDKIVGEYYISHMKAGMIKILDRDPGVDHKIWDSSFTREAFMEFVFANLFSLLREGGKDCAFLLLVVKRLIYRDSENNDRHVPEQ